MPNGQTCVVGSPPGVQEKLAIMKVMLYVAALIVLGPFILLAAYIAFRMIRSRLRVLKILVWRGWGWRLP